MIHGDFNVLSPLVKKFSFLKNYVNFFGGQVGDFQVATSGGFWVAIGETAKYLLENGRLTYQDEYGRLFLHSGFNINNQGDIEEGKGIEQRRGMEEKYKKYASIKGLEYNTKIDCTFLQKVLNQAEVKWTNTLEKNPEIVEHILYQTIANLIVFGHEKRKKILHAGAGLGIFGIDLQWADMYGDQGGVLQFGNNGVSAYYVDKGELGVEINIVTRQELMEAIEEKIQNNRF